MPAYSCLYSIEGLATVRIVNADSVESYGVYLCTHFGHIVWDGDLF